jgi:hypothetical protein
LDSFGKLVQQPRKGHLEAHVIVGDSDIAGRDLAQRADAEVHAIRRPTMDAWSEEKEEV